MSTVPPGAFVMTEMSHVPSRRDHRRTASSAPTASATAVRACVDDADGSTVGERIGVRVSDAVLAQAQCFRAVRRHLPPGGRFAFHVFNPNVRLLADTDGVRRPRASFTDPGRGDVHVDVAHAYDAAAQVTRGNWHFSTGSEPDFQMVSIEVRSIFPQELPVLLAHAGLRLVERLGNWDGSPFGADSSTQLCICESAA